MAASPPPLLTGQLWTPAEKKIEVVPANYPVGERQTSWRREPSVHEMINYLDAHAAKYKNWDKFTNAERFSTLSKAEFDGVVEQFQWCAEDFTYAARNYFWITDNQARDQLFTLWFSQHVILQKWYDLREQGKPQFIYVVKGRQVGASLLSQAMMAWRTMFFPNIEALTVSGDEEHSAYVFKFLLHIYDQMPWWLKPERASREEKSSIVFDNPDVDKRATEPGLHSAVYVQWSSKYSGVGQGHKILFAHCLNPNTIIRLADGGIKTITECVPGDMVITSRGNVAPVKRVWKSHRRNEVMAELKLWGNPVPLSLTRDHEVLTGLGYAEARMLRSGDRVAVPVRPITQPMKEFEIVNLGTGGHSGRGNKDISLAMHTLRCSRESFPLNYEWGWLFGLYLAEGSLIRNMKINNSLKYGSVVFSIHEKETEEFSRLLNRAIPKCRILKARRLGGKRVWLALYWAGISRYIWREFGYKDDKRVPAWAWQAGPEFCQGIVHGYLAGDGSALDYSNEITATSTRVALTLQIRDLCASLGYGWSSISFKPAGEHYGRNCQAAWTLKICGETSAKLRKEMGRPYRTGRKPHASQQPHWNYTEDGKFIEVEVESCADGFCEEVYDLEVDDPAHNFCTIQCCVKNCTEFADWLPSRARHIVQEDLKPAMKTNPEATWIIETTGKNSGKYQHRLWRTCERLVDAAQFYPMFIPAFMEPDRKRRVVFGWSPSSSEMAVREKARVHWARCDNCQRYTYRSLEGHDRVSGKDPCPFCKVGTISEFLMSDEQLYWIEVERRQAEGTGREALNGFRREYANSAEDAFLADGISVFPIEVQEMVAATIRDPKQCPGVIVGYFDTKNMKQPKLHGLNGDRPYQDIPGKFWCYTPECEYDHSSEEEQFNTTIWEKPLKGRAYCIGVDVAEGLGQNFSVIFVNKIGRMHEPDEQVARLRANNIDTIPLAYYCCLLGYWYNEALMCIEYEGVGKGTADCVRHDYQYPNIYRWKHMDSANIMSNKMHWYTKVDTRQKLWQSARHYLRQGAWIIRSKNFLDEMQNFQKDEEEDLRAGHADGETDDELFAGMISLYCAHEGDADERGVIHAPMVDTGPPKNPRYLMHCNACGHEWGADNPEYSKQCPMMECGSWLVMGKKMESDPLADAVKIGDSIMDRMDGYTPESGALRDPDQYLSPSSGSIDWDSL